MRFLVRTEIGLMVAFGAGLLVAYVGLAVCISGQNRFAGGGVLVLGLWLMIAAPAVHDRVHRERGEASHRLWGSAYRRKPRWWRAR